MAKKKAKRSPVSKASEKKEAPEKPDKKQSAKKAPTKKPVEEDSGSVPAKPRIPRAAKQLELIEQDKASFLEKGTLSFGISDDLRAKFQKIHDAHKHKDVLTTLTLVFEAGLKHFEQGGADPIPQASGNLLDEGATVDGEFDDTFDPDYEAAFALHATGQLV